MSRLADRVKEVTSTTGTGAKALGGAVSGFRGFLSTLGAGAVYYAEVHQSLAEWEVGIGALTASPDTLTASSILASSNAGAAVNFSAGLKDIFCTAPAVAFTTAGGVPGTVGLVGAPNATTPLTKYDLSADAVALRNPTDGSMVARFATGTLTNDITVAGPAANGRDQSAAFTASSWVYPYLIWNGTTLATLTSASATTPVLPTGYTHRAPAGALRINASVNFIPTQIRETYASIALTAVRASAAGTGAEQTYDLSVSIPPGHMGADVLMYTNNGSLQGDVRIAASGQVALTTNIGIANLFVVTGRVPLTSQTLYFIGSASATFLVSLRGYWMKL